jgi:O-6-methylguanine DNA methyltransferase
MIAFADKVRSAVGKIPAGKVATYGDIARIAGNPGASRAVGAVMRTNKDTEAVPCHRVVGHDGALTGYAYGMGIPTKKKMLAAEGVAFKGVKVDLAKSRWAGKK